MHAEVRVVGVQSCSRIQVLHPECIGLSMQLSRCGRGESGSCSVISCSQVLRFCLLGSPSGRFRQVNKKGCLCSGLEHCIALASALAVLQDGSGTGLWFVARRSTIFGVGGPGR